MDMGLIKCHVCGKYTSSTKEGRASHMKRYHGVVIRVEMPRYTPAEKMALVERGERKLGLHHFITPGPLPVAAVIHASSVPSKYCDPEGGNLCMWVKHGFDPCGPCAIRAQWEATNSPSPEPEITYRD